MTRISLPPGQPSREPSHPARAGAPGPDATGTGSTPPATVAIHTHGCKLNQADSESLARCFAEAGYQVVDWTAGADVLVLNTCTVTVAADAKARQALRAARRSNGKAFIVATGCYAQRAAGRLSRLEGVSLVAGNTQKDRLVAAVAAALAERQGERHSDPAGFAGSVSDGGRKAQPGPARAESATGRNRAMVKVQEGCDQVCAYCVVPRVRGRERSIPQKAVLREVNNRAVQGCREVVLTGTQLGAYGCGLPGASLPALLRRILAESAVPRLRVSSLQPQEVTEELLELWEDPRLCPHFHLPLQSGSGRILESMRRHYDPGRFARSVELIRRTLPGAGITTDLMVGFPGEGDGEHQESRHFTLAMQFSDMHIFPFSARPGTSAAYLNGRVPEAVKKARAAEMAQVAGEGFRAFRLGQLGQTRPVLWESARQTGAVPIWSGLTDNYIRVSAQDQRDLRNVVTRARLLELVDGRVTCGPS